MTSFTVECHVGRVVEARVNALATLEDVDAYGRAFAPFLARPRPSILCADHRPVKLYPPEVADKLARLFTGLNRVWERAALIASRQNALFTMQLQRLVRESGNDSRRLFLDADGAEIFLGESLEKEERERLRIFLR